MESMPALLQSLFAPRLLGGPAVSMRYVHRITTHTLVSKHRQTWGGCRSLASPCAVSLCRLDVATSFSHAIHFQTQFTVIDANEAYLDPTSMQKNSPIPLKKPSCCAYLCVPSIFKKAYLNNTYTWGPKARKWTYLACRLMPDPFLRVPNSMVIGS